MASAHKWIYSPPTFDLCLPSSRQPDILNLPNQSIIPDSECFENTKTFSRQNHYCYSRMAQPTPVSNSHGQIKPTFSISKSLLISAGQRADLLCRISSITFPNYVDFVKEAYSLLYSPESANILVQPLTTFDH